MFPQKTFSSPVDSNKLQFFGIHFTKVSEKTLKPWPPLTTKAPRESTPLCTDGMKLHAFFHPGLMRSYVWPHSAVLEAQDSPEPLNPRGITQRKIGHKENGLQPHWEAGWYHFERATQYNMLSQPRAADRRVGSPQGREKRSGIS